MSRPTDTFLPSPDHLIRRRDLLIAAGAGILGMRSHLPASASEPISIVADQRADGLASQPNEYGETSRWQTLRIGAGGFLVGLDITADGTFVVRTDTYGAWLWEASISAWRQLVTIESMPHEDRNEDSSALSWPLDIAIAPSDPKRLYMALGGYVYRSDDKGLQWRKTAAPQVSGMGVVANRAKVNGRKMAIDPASPAIVFVGSPFDPIRVTRDSGISWLEVGDIPLAQTLDGEPMGYLIIFDPTSRAAQSTAVVYAASWGNGIYRSADNGETWDRMPDGPSCLHHAAVGNDGILYVISEKTTDPTTRVFRFDASWTDITPKRASVERWHSIAASPHDPGRLLIGKEDGSLCQSFDRGTTWEPVIHRSHIRRRADDVPWLAWTNEDWMSNGDIRFDYSVPDRLVYAQGIGVWSTILQRGAKSVEWVSQSSNIEQLVSNQCTHPPVEGAAPILCCWDRAIWRLTDPDAYPYRHYPDRDFAHCWGVDYASSDPSFLAATISSQQVTDEEQSCFSTNGGRSWRPFASYPVWNASKAGKGFIAVSTPINMLWVPSEARGMPHVTTDGGLHWRKCALPGVVDQDAIGFGAADFMRRYCACADRVALGTFYLLHYPKGLFCSSDGGESWHLVNSFIPWNNRFHSKLRAVPGRAEYLFHTAGHSNARQEGPFIRSFDGGVTWSALPDISEVADFAFGKAAPGSPYWTLYIAGYLSGAWGVYQSIDDGETWTQVGDGFPTGSLDRIVALEADKNVFCKLYVGLRGSGWTYFST